MADPEEPRPDRKYLKLLRDNPAEVQRKREIAVLDREVAASTQRVAEFDVDREAERILKKREAEEKRPSPQVQAQLVEEARRRREMERLDQQLAESQRQAAFDPEEAANNAILVERNIEALREKVKEIGEPFYDSFYTEANSPSQHATVSKIHINSDGTYRPARAWERRGTDRLVEWDYSGDDQYAMVAKIVGKHEKGKFSPAGFILEGYPKDTDLVEMRAAAKKGKKKAPPEPEWTLGLGFKERELQSLDLKNPDWDNFVAAGPYDFRSLNRLVHGTDLEKYAEVHAGAMDRSLRPSGTALTRLYFGFSQTPFFFIQFRTHTYSLQNSSHGGYGSLTKYSAYDFPGLNEDFVRRFENYPDRNSRPEIDYAKNPEVASVSQKRVTNLLESALEIIPSKPI